MTRFRIQMNFTAEGDLDEVTEIHDAVVAFAESRRLNFEGGFVEPIVDVLPPCPRCKSTSVNCPLKGPGCPYDEPVEQVA